MLCEKRTWTADGGWVGRSPNLRDAGLVLYFGDREVLAEGSWLEDLHGTYPKACFIGCSTGGQIARNELLDGVLVAIAVRFAATRVSLADFEISGPADSRTAGEAIGQALAADDLSGVFVLSDGLLVNGSSLVAGLGAVLGPSVPISGGLAGDGPHFKATTVGVGTDTPREGRVAAVGFYGSAIRLGYGSGGGWESFGPSRLVTRSASNLLLQLDSISALDLYERYLGDEASGLPGTGLHYPLRVWNPAKPQHDVVRTVLAVDRNAKTMTFAGDIPQGFNAQLMHGRFEELVAAAAEAATHASSSLPPTAESRQQLAILVSCIGRRLAMGQATGDEIQAATARFPPGTMTTGFYSYGEVAPHRISGVCELHNQSMTVTVISEAPG